MKVQSRLCLVVLTAAGLAASATLGSAVPLAPVANSAAGFVTLTDAKAGAPKAAKKAAAKKAVKKVAARKAPAKAAKAAAASGKSCGTYMYYSTKERKCLDARAKAK